MGANRLAITKRPVYYKSLTINVMHGEGIEPPIGPNTIRDRPQMSILSGFAGN